MKKLAEDIKSGSFKQVYLLYGPEDYLRRQYRDRLREALSSGSGDTSMNTHYYTGKDVSFGEIVDLAETMPFFAERRVIVIEDAFLFKNAGAAEALTEYLQTPAQTAYFILVEKEADKRTRLFKTVKEKGYAAEFPVQNEATLSRWILSLIKKDGLKITRDALDTLLSYAGSDMENIRTETEKLICYCMERGEITEADVEAVCVRRAEEQIFAMIDALTEKRRRDAMRLYADLLSLKEPPLRILSLLARQYNLLLQVGELAEKRKDAQTIARMLNLRDFVARKYLRLSSRVSKIDARRALIACVRTEEDIKTGKLSDTLGVELLLYRNIL